mgnify:CR=1 FL=1
MNGDLKIGKLLCDEDIITKRQLNQALQAQIKGDKRTLGEILVDKGFCSLDDITEVIMETAEDHDHDVVQEEIVEKIEQVSAQVAEPKELSEEDMDDVYDTIEEMEELIKDLRKEISSLEKRKRDK